MQASISGDRFEIAGGKIAVGMGSAPAVKKLGQRLIKDHTMSLSQSIAVAKKLKLKVPMAPTPSEVWELQTVHAMSGHQFDLAYATLETKDHQQDIEEATFEATHGSNSTIKQLATKALPMLKTHLALSQKAAESV